MPSTMQNDHPIISQKSAYSFRLALHRPDTACFPLLALFTSTPIVISPHTFAIGSRFYIVATTGPTRRLRMSAVPVVTWQSDTE